MSGNISFLGQNSCCAFLPPCQLQCWHHRMFELSSVSYFPYDLGCLYFICHIIYMAGYFVFYLSCVLYGSIFCNFGNLESLSYGSKDLLLTRVKLWL